MTGHRVACLEHEAGDDAVEGGALVVEGLAGAAGALLAGAQAAEVLQECRERGWDRWGK